MLIGIDGNEANQQVKVGSGQFAFNLLWSLYKVDRKNNYVIYLKDSPRQDLPPVKDGWEYHIFGPKKLWTKIALPLRLLSQSEHLDCFYTPGHYLPLFCPFPRIVTIHDLGYLQSKEQFTKKDYYQLVFWTRASLSSANHIAAVSEFTRDELTRIYKINQKKISIVSNGVGDPPLSSKEKSAEIVSKFNITKPYFLCLGTLKPNKNIPLLIKSFAKFLSSQPKIDNQYQLVIAGKKGWLYKEIFETVKQEKLQDSVIFTDYITEEEKWALYRLALATVLPSTYEGFGIPAIESMKVGTPVIASNIRPFEEVVGKSGLIFDLNKSSDLIAKMTQITNPVIRKKYAHLSIPRADFYTWDNSAHALIKVFERYEKK